MSEAIKNNPRPIRVLVAASGGGHWQQLCRIVRPIVDDPSAFARFAGNDQHRPIELHAATTLASLRDQLPAHRFHLVPEANRTCLFKCAWAMVRIGWLILRIRPDVVITTGAAPGLIALRIGRWFGSRTVWIDSMANVDKLSLSGRRAGPYADLWITQWEHLARSEGPHYMGMLL
ncbi:MAG: UDP-N-acetylglucosamine--LPS N-acetylglucosamine transferase [Planctomycetota bacterium]